MSKLPVIAVIGSTGAQGGGLARAILTDLTPRFAVRAITRKTDSPAARELAVLGATVVAGDLDDAASIRRAVEGASAVYAVTNFWEHFSPEREQLQARNIAEAVKTAATPHVVWSTLEDSRAFIPLSDPRMPVLQQKYKVPHFDAKGEADAFFKGLPTTCLRTSFYWDNLIHFGMGPKRGEDGVLNFLLPMGKRKLPGIAAGDIGGCAYGIFKRGKEFIGQTIGIAGEHLTGAQMAASLAKALGEPVRHVDMPHAAYAKLGFPGADDLANMFQFNHDFVDEFCAQRPLALSRELNPGLLTFEKWLDANSSRIPR